MIRQNLYLIRHGETIWNQKKILQGQQDIPLSENGLYQALTLAEHLQETKPDAIYSSDLSRAYETAKIIARTANIERVNVTNRLRERFYGTLEAKPLDEVSALVPDYAVNWRQVMRYEMESLEDLQSRTVQQITQIMKRESNRNIVIVCHGGVINCFIHYLTKGRNGTGRLRLNNTSVSTFRYHDPNWRIISLNMTDHLHKSPN
ncbi:histidine phosphatase family protein [Sporolactobacillus shoreicorticis]|uniref:Histidine phosphatase family protein n=1 Tax=Sporolactobacillus shoreicorticis TaxID=1923877 RepID=A0ABW5S067_9BACL|nr:histidine phosphatase family protein [Sporolactobacillus shoreicorticis]MCO7125059.1 histidine phosphatase family protein [Sporolactobacillus shoreicorticis]